MLPVGWARPQLARIALIRAVRVLVAGSTIVSHAQRAPLFAKWISWVVAVVNVISPASWTLLPALVELAVIAFVACLVAEGTLLLPACPSARLWNSFDLARVGLLPA